ncbi:MAG: hypothetical protein JRI49_05160 [Deltaproteobacteria bacterium]|nr:hypothetical protein [Deltaproteobacteria bacterium]
MILTNKNIRIELSDHLFWDIPIEKLDLDKNRRLIIKRVLSRGNKTEFARIYSYYGKDLIKESIMKSNDLDPRTMNFINKLSESL